MSAGGQGARICACHECGLVQRTVALEPGSAAWCVRCGSRLYALHRSGLQGVLAFYLGALILFIVANSFTFMVMKLEGQAQEMEPISAAIALWNAEMPALAVVVFCASVLMPGLKILLSLWVLLPAAAGRLPPFPRASMRLLDLLRPWAMMEVFLLGALVAYVKLGDLATLQFGVSAIAFVGAIVCMAAADAGFDQQFVWRLFGPQATTAMIPPAPGTRLCACHECGQITPMAVATGEPAHCPRCGAHLHFRKPNSLNRAWALLLTAIVLYIPANIFPVMTVIYFGQGAPSTIISGVVELAEGGMWPLALLVFFASILVPMLKIIGLTYLLISIQTASVNRPRDRTRLYRIVESVGRWSMIDVFMIGILTALVKLGAIATIEPGVGAVAFCGVVIVTMLAAMALDPRLLWDAHDAQPGREEIVRA